MELALQLLMFAYIIVAFFITNILAKKFVTKYDGRKWLKRRIIIPIGCLIMTVALFGLAAIARTEILIIVIVPLISFFVGVVAYTSFIKVAKYDKEARANSPYMKK